MLGIWRQSKIEKAERHKAELSKIQAKNRKSDMKEEGPQTRGSNYHILNDYGLNSRNVSWYFCFSYRVENILPSGSVCPLF